jgi:hypothetical protein
MTPGVKDEIGYAESNLTNRIDEAGGLLRIAVSHNRPEILALLRQYGFDPDERTRYRDVGVDGVVFTWGMPLCHSIAGSRDHVTADERVAFATILLDAGARLDLPSFLWRIIASLTPCSRASSIKCPSSPKMRPTSFRT